MRRWPAWVLLLVAACALRAQSDNATITGMVTDPSPAVIPRVRVVATNLDTELRFATASNASGYYTIPALPPGPYRLEAEMPGFRRFVRERFVLEARRIVRLDVVLELGQVSEAVQVTMPVPLIESETGSVSESLGRGVLDLVPKTSATEPFTYLVSMSNVVSGYPGAYLFSIAGARTTQYDYAIDGISNRGEPMTGAGSTLESISELTLHPVNNSAEFGSSAVISVVSKGGTNRLHGELSYYHSNSALNARDFFAVAKPEFKSHAWGVDLNGPLVVPGVYNGRNRTFFAVAWHGSRNPGFGNANVTVPTAAMRVGDFSGLAVIRDPLGGVFAGGLIPASRLSPVALRVQELFYPAANFGSGATLNSRSLYRQRALQDRVDVRVDQKVSARNVLFARWGTRLLPMHTLESNLTTIGLSDSYRRARNAVVADTHTFSSTVVNEFRYGFRVDHIYMNAPMMGRAVVDAIGLEGLNVAAGVRGVPSFTINGVAPIAASRHASRADSLHEWIDSLTVIRGKHTWKAGADVQRHACCLDEDYPDDYFGAFQFTGFFTGAGYADFLLGLPETASRGTPRGPSSRQKYLSSYYQFYVQDDVKLLRNVTLNLGVRYEFAPVPRDQDGMMYNVDGATGRVLVPDERIVRRVNPLLPGNVAVAAAGALRRADTNNVVPRVGLAWQFRPRWVVRGGYGIYVDALRYDAAPAAGSPLFAYSETFENFAANRPVYGFPNPFGDAGSLGAIGVTGMNPRLVNPYVQQWNLTAEHAVGGVGIRASYVGTKATKLAYQRELDVAARGTTPFSPERLPFPQFRSLTMTDNGGNSIYHALQVEAQRRLARGLSFQSAFTWAKTIADVDDQDNDSGALIEDPANRRRERAPQGYSFKYRSASSVTWAVPVGANAPLWVRRVAGGWNVGAVVYFQSGALFQPTFAGVDAAGMGIVGGRPDRVADGNLQAGERTLDRWFNTAAFAVPAANRGWFGSSARNVLEGPGLNVQHFNVMRSVGVREGVRLELFVNVFNALNHPGFDLPHADLSDGASFGRVTATRFLLEQNSSSRSMLMEVRVVF